MGEKRNFTQCRQCKYFVDDDDSLKSAIEYCILLGININDSCNCPDYIPLDRQSSSLKKETHIEPEPVP
ncbi:MAG: hypothetical protein JEY91_16370 [Spirochaetaceae bacterium]|nr:hypothetical protein [Spirochaetaceae bacterium]